MDTRSEDDSSPTDSRKRRHAAAVYEGTEKKLRITINGDLDVKEEEEEESLILFELPTSSNVIESNEERTASSDSETELSLPSLTNFIQDLGSASSSSSESSDASDDSDDPTNSEHQCTTRKRTLLSPLNHLASEKLSGAPAQTQEHLSTLANNESSNTHEDSADGDHAKLDDAS